MIDRFYEKEKSREKKGKLTRLQESGNSPALAFKKYLIKALDEIMMAFYEERVGKLMDSQPDHEMIQEYNRMSNQEKSQALGIADIRFSFHQGDILYLLKLRGEKISRGEFK